MKKLILEYQKLRMEKAERETLIELLIRHGIPQDKTDEFMSIYDNAFKAGINHVITKGASSQNIKFGENPVFDSAFNMGKHIFRRESSFLYRNQNLILSIIISTLIILITKQV